GFPSGTSVKACQVAWPVRADRTLPSIAITLTSAPGRAAGTVRGRYRPRVRPAASWPECVGQLSPRSRPGWALCVRRVTFDRQNGGPESAPVAQLDRAAAF